MSSGDTNAINGELRSDIRRDFELTANGVSVDSLQLPRPPVHLHDRLAYWQRQLRLMDWEITVERSTSRDINNGTCANTNITATTKEARMRILAEAEWPPPSERTGAWDEELFMVHELLHIHLDLWDGVAADERESPQFKAKESAIDLIATALLRLERGERR